MTNTREAFEAEFSGSDLTKAPNGSYIKKSTQAGWLGYQAATAQQASVIAELVEALEAIISLEHIPTNFGVARTIARSAIAKVKGK